MAIMVENGDFEEHDAALPFIVETLQRTDQYCTYTQVSVSILVTTLIDHSSICCNMNARLRSAYISMDPKHCCRLVL